MQGKKKRSDQSEIANPLQIKMGRTRAKNKKNEAPGQNDDAIGRRPRTKYEIVIRLIEHLRA